MARRAKGGLRPVKPIVAVASVAAIATAAAFTGQRNSFGYILGPLVTLVGAAIGAGIGSFTRAGGTTGAIFGAAAVPIATLVAGAYDEARIRRVQAARRVTAPQPLPQPVPLQGIPRIIW